MHQRYLMNDTVAKQRVLGAIHAAPNGITLTTPTCSQRNKAHSDPPASASWPAATRTAG